MVDHPVVAVAVVVAEVGRMQQIFDGIKILDLTKVYSGPLATRYFAEYGAQVIKIESNNHPDPTRFFPPLLNGWSGYYEMLNGTKEKLELNLRSEVDKQHFFELVAHADIVVENMLPQTKHSLGISYEEVKEKNPQIIYASLAGIDQNSTRRYYDLIAQAESGLLSLSGTPTQPMKIGPAVVDAFSGVNLSFALAAALYYREKTGLGQNIEVSMLGGAVNLLEQNLIEYSMTHRNPTRPENQDTAIAPFGLFRAKDKHVALAIGDDELWNNFTDCELYFTPLQQAQFKTNGLRLENLVELVSQIEEIFSRYTASELVEMLSRHNIPISVVKEMSDVLATPWFFETGALRWIEHPTLGKCVVPGKHIVFSAAR